MLNDKKIIIIIIRGEKGGERKRGEREGMDGTLFVAYLRSIFPRFPLSFQAKTPHAH